MWNRSTKTARKLVHCRHPDPKLASIHKLLVWCSLSITQAHDTCHTSRANSPTPTRSAGTAVPHLQKFLLINLWPIGVRCRFLPLRMCCESRIHLRRRVVAHRSELCCSEALANYFSFVVAKKTGKIRLQREIRAAHYGWCFKLGCLFTSQLDSARHHGWRASRPSWSHQRGTCADDGETPSQFPFVFLATYCFLSSHASKLKHEGWRERLHWLARLQNGEAKNNVQQTTHASHNTQVSTWPTEETRAKTQHHTQPDRKLEGNGLPANLWRSAMEKVCPATTPSISRTVQWIPFQFRLSDVSETRL